ncbi:hypothetical protein ADILRU_0725 [Leifsonia rubra CMS 76R]|nr:hypothetical protein ADILRU_0725 [Leifsonia rubra CMS 76R]
MFTKSMAITIALVTTLSLSGCFANPLDQIGESIAQGGAEKLIEGATGGEVDLETDGEMPKDFPNEVPVVDGKVEFSTGLTIDGSRSWTVSFSVDDAESAMSSAREELVAAGFEEVLWSDASMIMGSFSSDAYLVIVSAYADEDEQVVSYQVSENTDGE